MKGLAHHSTAGQGSSSLAEPKMGTKRSSARADGGVPACMKTLCLPLSSCSSSWEGSTCAPYALNSALVPSQGRSSHPAQSPGTVPAGGMRFPTATHTAGDFLAHPLVHKESITVLRDHRQCQCDPPLLRWGGWINAVSTFLHPGRGHNAAAGTALPSDISEHNQL